MNQKKPVWIHPSSFILPNTRSLTNVTLPVDDINDSSLQGFAAALRGLPMPELRKDPIVGRWVIIATDRAKRPVAPKQDQALGGTGFCPFCEGGEENTPHEILAYRKGGTRSNEKGWRVRVVPNKFPALQ